MAARVERVPLEHLALATRLLALEGVGNPDNVGGLFRTAFALGVAAVLIDRSTADPLYRKAIRTSMAASLRVPFARVEPWPSGLDELKALGFRVLALTPDPGAPSIDEYEIEPGGRLDSRAGIRGRGSSARVAALCGCEAAHSDRPPSRFAERRGGRGDRAEPARTYLTSATRLKAFANERQRVSHANGACRRSGARESVLGSPRGEAPRIYLSGSRVGAISFTPFREVDSESLSFSLTPSGTV